MINDLKKTTTMQQNRMQNRESIQGRNVRSVIQVLQEVGGGRFIEWVGGECDSLDIEEKEE